MKKLIALCLALLLPVIAHGEDTIFWTQDGYRVVALNARREALLLSEQPEERDGLVVRVGMRITQMTEDMQEMWGTVIGGNDIDKLEQAIATDDGWIVAGSSSSSDLVEGWHEGTYDGKEPKSDAWVVRLDTEGQILWMRLYGGSDWDSFNSICAAHDGGWIVAGHTYSDDGDVVGWHNSGDIFRQPDAWVLHIDEAGEILWQQTLGGTGYDELFSIRKTETGYMAVGVTDSADGDVEGGLGDRDGWVVCLDVEGNLTGQTCYGGGNEDSFDVLAQRGEYYLAVGNSWSRMNGELLPENAWAVLLDEQGEAIWMARFGEKAIAHIRHAFWEEDMWLVAGYDVEQGVEEVTDWVIGLSASGQEWQVLRRQKPSTVNVSP